MGKIIFVTGGARSGKSTLALERANLRQGPKTFIATAESLDDEMSERIEKHRRQRDADWTTIESPIEVSLSLQATRESSGPVILDCLTLWVSNLLLSGRKIPESFDPFLTEIRENRVSELYVVSNEVGLGVVPDNSLAREFRDAAGYLNQKVAMVSDEVYFVVAGLPMRLK